MFFFHLQVPCGGTNPLFRTEGNEVALLLHYLSKTMQGHPSELCCWQKMLNGSPRSKGWRMLGARHRFERNVCGITLAQREAGLLPWSSFGQGSIFSTESSVDLEPCLQPFESVVAP